MSAEKSQPGENNMRFEGKVVVITGAASGIGLAATRRFGSEGALLSLADINADLLTSEVEALGIEKKRVAGHRVDVSVESEVTELIAATVERFGRIDVLINNAGIGAFGHVTEVTPADWRNVFAVDLDAVYYGCRAAIPHLAKTHGNIVNTASISGMYGDYGFSAYNAAKAAVINLTRAMALDHAPQGIRVNAVSPGLIATPLASALHGDNRVMSEYARLVPLARAGKPGEIASAMAFLASDDASYVTGFNMVVDGGLTAATGQPNFNRLFRDETGAINLPDQ
jgi:meso-butanediol dehydrogenase/(S,S)-butanediol dehydrogenase/diacetyl reductase